MFGEEQDLRVESRKVLRLSRTHPCSKISGQGEVGLTKTLECNAAILITAVKRFMAVAVFTTIYFLCNLQVGLISSCFCFQAFSVQSNVCGYGQEPTLKCGT